MKRAAIIIIAIGTVLQSCGQTSKSNVVEFDDFVNKLNSVKYRRDTINPPLIYKDENFEICLADKSLGLKEKRLVLKNPYSSNKFPLSFSVILKDRIITLFDPGKFACYDFTLNRDFDLEKRLNKRRFEYHWIIGHTLVAESEGKLYSWVDGKGWQIFQNANPMNHQPKLFEDEKYIVFFDCNGEFGGTVYFYDKLTKATYFTEATCPNSVLRKENSYYVFSSLGHGVGSVDLKLIANPEKLSRLQDNIKSKLNYEQQRNIGYADSSNQSKTIFDYYGIQAFSSFKRDDKTLYMIHWRDYTFLSEINNNIISLVDPLFINEEIYTHDPVTTTYDNGIVLMNFDFYGLGREREVAIILVDKNSITKIDWSEKH